MTLPLVEFPELVEHYAPFFESVFLEQALVQFQRYVSGLIVSENKTVDGINRIFVHETRNQSSLNRLLTESPFSLEALNQARLALLGSLPDTRFKPKGVLSVDNTLLTHYGRHFDQIAYLYDPTEERYTWTHDWVNVHYSDDQTDYPAYFQLWKPADLEKIEKGLRAAQIPLRESKLGLKETDTKKWRQYLLGVWRRHQSKPEVAVLYESKLVIARQLLRRWVSGHPELKLPVTFDNWYTQPAFCRFLDKELDLPYVGTLANDDVVILKSGQETLESLAERLKQEHLTAIASGHKPVFRKSCIDMGGNPVTTDQRGVARPQGITCDVGAYEAQPELSLTKAVDDDNPQVGQRLTYTITVENSGRQDATNALVSDTLPSSLTFAGPATLEGTSSTVAQDAGDLPTLASGLTITAGQRITVSFPVTVDTDRVYGTILTNTATVTSTEVTTPTTGSVGVTVRYRVYLPLILRNYASTP